MYDTYGGWLAGCVSQQLINANYIVLRESQNLTLFCGKATMNTYRSFTTMETIGSLDHLQLFPTFSWDVTLCRVASLFGDG